MVRNTGCAEEPESQQGRAAVLSWHKLVQTTPFYGEICIRGQLAFQQVVLVIERPDRYSPLYRRHPLRPCPSCFTVLESSTRVVLEVPLPVAPLEAHR